MPGQSGSGSGSSLISIAKRSGQTWTRAGTPQNRQSRSNMHQCSHGQDHQLRLLDVLKILTGGRTFEPTALGAPADR